MSTPVVRREFWIPASADFSLIQNYITSVVPFADTGTVQFDQATRYNASGFVDQYYKISTQASPTNDASILSAGNTFTSSNPSLNILVFTYSINEGA